MNGWYDVTTFGARGDGSTPAEEAIEAALAAASTKGGGVIWFPPGRYLLSKKVIVQQQCTLLGAGWSSRDLSQGSWIVVQEPGVNLELRGEGTAVQSLGFFQQQPPPQTDTWQPADHDFAIHAAADDIFLQQLHLLCCTKGINIRGHKGEIGRVIVDHVFGRPLRTGIEIDNARDVVKVNNIHFWPFWEMSNKIVEKWVAQHGTAIAAFRADNPQLSNLFAFGYNRGIAFGASSNGMTSKFAITNADCDICETGIEVGGANTTGAITNFSAQGAPGNVGLSVVGPGSRVFATNLRLTKYRCNAVRAAGKKTRLFLNNLWAEEWNLSGSGFPGVEAADGAQVFLGRPLFFDKGNGAEHWGTNGRKGAQVLTEFDQLVSE